MEGDDRQKAFEELVELGVQALNLRPPLAVVEVATSPDQAAKFVMRTIELDGGRSIYWLDGVSRYFYDFDPEAWPEFIRKVVTDAVTKGIELRLASVPAPTATLKDKSFPERQGATG